MRIVVFIRLFDASSKINYNWSKNYDGRMNILRQGKYMASDEKCFEEKIFIGVCAPLCHDVL